MPFEPGVSGNPGGRVKQKPFSDALWLELHRLADGELHKHPKGSLAWNAQRLALDGRMPAICQIRDTLQGKPSQAIDLNDESATPGYREWLAWVIADGVRMREALEAQVVAPSLPQLEQQLEKPNDINKDELLTKQPDAPAS